MTFITNDHINNHFITNPEWERVFLKHYPNWSNSNYIEDAKKLFESNGCMFDIRIVSKHYGTLEVDLYYKEKFVFGRRGSKNTVEQIIISAICDYELDISKFQ